MLQASNGRADTFHPRWFGLLPEETRAQFASFLNYVELIGEWPSQLAITLIKLIPKAKGGKRPIGLLTGLVRLWERIRIHEVRAWKTIAYRGYNWAARGRSAQDAIWKQNMTCEAAAAEGRTAIAKLADLRKAYEMVPLENVWRAGLKMHFPPWILRLELEAFAAARTVVVNGAYANPVDTLSALVAGGSFATDFLFTVLAEPCDQILLEHPRQPLCTIDIFLYADDVVTLVTGPSGGAANTEAVDVTENLLDKFEGAMKMEVSRSSKPWKLDKGAKSIALASASRARQRLKPSMRRLGIDTVGWAENLGVDF